MTSLAKSLALGACALLITALPAAAADTVRITVEGVRSANGLVLAELCTEPAAFPYEGCPHRLAIQAKEGAVDIVFGDVEPGVYAFAVFVDEDGDYLLDEEEGAAFSNDATTVDFSKAAFAVDGDTTHKVRLYYGPK